MHARWILIQIQYCKDFLGVYTSVNDCVALGECGRLPLCIDHHFKCIKWIKLLCMSDNRYQRNCFLMLKEYDSVGRINWAFSIQNLLHRHGFWFV
jgi:hypothetical protein